MDKAVLVMNTPKKCLDCNLCVLNMDASLSCYYYKREICSNVEENNSRPEWCLLKPLPEKRSSHNTEYEYDDGYADGWDECIDRITGGNYDD